MRAGSVTDSWSFGHWAYGSRDAIVDGILVPGDSSRLRGLNPNPVMLPDKTVKDVCLTDPIGGSASFYDTPVKLVVI